ncbi:NHL repeat-containing protein [Hanstruepera ponticola]|uniref:hypothetical protein n=1 Tax=Hanstruepera ponticola TaxID=2042995 RepID=UPI00178766DC|nr:hypothetical protein [Hanstruepera ponticola]
MKYLYSSIIFVFCLIVYLQIQYPPVHVNKSLKDQNLNYSTMLYSSYFLANVPVIKTKSTDDLFGDLKKTNGLAFDSKGHIYVVEHSKSQIVKYDEDGVVLNTFKVTDGYPLHIIKSFDSDAMIFTNVTDNSINKLSEHGKITKLYKGYPLDVPVGLTYNAKGLLHVSNYKEKKVFSFKDYKLQYITTLPEADTIVCKAKK